MKVGFLSLALLVVAFAGSAGNPAFAQSQQPRNQTQPQEGLPPNMKSRLTGIGPEDVFGVSGEDSRNRGTGKQQQQQQQQQQRKPQSTPVPPSTLSPRSSTTPAAEPSAEPSATPAQSSTPEASPTASAGAIENGIQSPPLGQVTSSDRLAPKWAAPISLIALALIVLAALTFTLTKLFEKIREGSSG